MPPAVAANNKSVKIFDKSIYKIKAQQYPSDFLNKWQKIGLKYHFSRICGIGKALINYLILKIAEKKDKVKVYYFIFYK